MKALKWIGLGALVGVAAVGVVLARPMRSVIEVNDEELSRRLHAFHDARSGT